METGRKRPLYWVSTYSQAKWVHIVKYTPEENSAHFGEQRGYGYYYCNNPYNPTLKNNLSPNELQCREATSEDIKRLGICPKCTHLAREAGEIPGAVRT
jgi:hypothetical protein